MIMSDSDDVGPALPAGYVAPELPDLEESGALGQKRSIEAEDEQPQAKKIKPKGANLQLP